MKPTLKQIAMVPVELPIFFLITILLAYPTKWLWNATMPELFGLKEIGVWMAWKISFLCYILFKAGTNFTDKKVLDFI
jgi:hypothetical protein